MAISPGDRLLLSETVTPDGATVYQISDVVRRDAMMLLAAVFVCLTLIIGRLRGLASLVLGLVYLEKEVHLPGEGTIRMAVMATVVLSIYAHGITALPGIRFYVRRLASLGPNSPEQQT